MQTEDSPEEAGGAVVTRADPETSKQRNLDGIKPGATKPAAPEPLPESVKAAHRRKLALAAKQAGALTQPGRSTPEPASIELETISEREARLLVNRIRAHINDARALVLELYEREGWRSLGYNSWRECVVAEFDQSQSRLYQLLDAAQVERNISTIVENSSPIHEAVLRPLAGLEPDQQREAWKMATEATPTPTAEHVARVAYSLRPVKKKSAARSKTEKLLKKLPISGEEERRMRKKFAFFWDQLINDPRFSGWRLQKCASIVTDYLDSYLAHVEERAVEAVYVEPDQSTVEFCEVGWLLLTTERDLAVLALTPANDDWETAGLQFFESLRKRKIIAV